jgi:hypothetical protein
MKIYYNTEGNKIEDINASVAYIDNEHNNFYIKKADIGRYSGRLFNVNLMSELLDKYSKQKGKTALTFKKVPESVFKSYLKYLETKNEGYLRNAERGLD